MNYQILDPIEFFLVRLCDFFNGLPKHLLVEVKLMSVREHEVSILEQLVVVFEKWGRFRIDPHYALLDMPVQVNVRDV